MTQHQLVIEYCNEFGSILPAKMAGVVYKEVMFGSETSKRCRELRGQIQGEWKNPYKKQMLESEGEGKFERFYLLGQKPIKEFVFKTTATTNYCCVWKGINGVHSSNCITLKEKINNTLF